MKKRKSRVEPPVVRTTSEIDDLIVGAAEREGKSLNDFILDNALSVADAIVHNQAYYPIDKRQWEAFCETLDSPPRKIPGLRKFLTEQGVFDAK